MKFKVGDNVIVVRADHTWIYWIELMDSTVGHKYKIAGTYRFRDGVLHPTIIIKGVDNGLPRNQEEFVIPEYCLEYAIKPGEQLLFDFMLPEPT